MSTVLLIVVFVVGIAMVLYPTVSNYINQLHATHVVESYSAATDSLAEAEREGLLEAAGEYNDSLADHAQSYVSGEPQDDAYRSLLNITDNGVMGYVTIKKLDIQLPIYHGTDDRALAVGAGHLEGSSLPVGGVGTHSVITSHRGLPAAKLFTDLDQLEAGDTFTITVLGRTLTYQVDQIKIVLPGETKGLDIDPDQDYCTLLTCTPYSVNTHRLLVRGVRIANANDIYVPADAKIIDPVAIAPLVAAPILLILLVLLLRGKLRGVDSPRASNTKARAYP